MARKHIAAALLELQGIRSSAAFLSSGQAPIVIEGSKQRGSTASGRPAIGFVESVNRRLLAPTPPRSIKILSWENVSSLVVTLFVAGSFFCEGMISKHIITLMWFGSREPMSSCTFFGMTVVP